MRRLRGLLWRLGGLFGRGRHDRDLADEMDSHLALHIDDNLRRGMSPAEARRDALLRLGGVEPTKEDVRDRRGVPAVEKVAKDVRFALRVLRKNPAYAAVVIVTLGLGIGVNTAIFSIVDGVLLRPLPYADADRLVQVWHTPPQDSFPGQTRFSISPANYLDWRDQNHAFEHISAYGPATLTYTGGDRPEAVPAAAVAPDLFAALGVRPLLGRTFTDDEDAPGKDKVVVLGEKFWRAHFAADARVVGRTVRLGGDSYVVAGVMPAGFRFPQWADMWIPLAWSAKDRAVRGIHDYAAIARLRPGVSVAQAQAEMDAISGRLAQAYPEDDKGWGALVVPLRDEVVGDVAPALLVLLVAVSFVLLIACANVANLVLARTLARRKEIALRLALGASRGRVIQQILSENVVLALVGGSVGLLVAWLGLDSIVGLIGDELPRAAEVGIDGRILAFTLAISILTGLAAGIVPALRLTRSDLADALKQGLGKSGSDTGGNRTRSGLVIAEVALSLVLLVGAGLMIRTLGILRAVNPGFDPHGVLSMTLALPMSKYPSPPEQAAFYQRMLERVRALPGVDAAGVVTSLPMMGGSTQPIAIDGQPVVAQSEQPEVAVRVIAPGYLATMRIPVVRGRDVRDSDGAGQPNVILVSESMARRFWPGEDPIGKRLVQSFYPDVAREVVGVVADVKLSSLAAAATSPTLYVPLAQQPRPWMALVVRGARPDALAPSVTGAIREVDAEQPAVNVMTLDAFLDQTLAHQRFAMMLLALFAALALALAGIGIYSVLSYSVRRRVQEIGIRVALGARRGDVLWMVLGHGLRLTLAGLVVGALAAVALGRLLAGLLYGVAPTDPLTFGAVAALLVAIALVACYLPARRAVRVDPMVAMRCE